MVEWQKGIWSIKETTQGGGTRRMKKRSYSSGKPKIPEQSWSYSSSVPVGQMIRFRVYAGKKKVVREGKLMDNTDPSLLTVQIGGKLVRIGRYSTSPPPRFRAPRLPAERKSIVEMPKTVRPRRKVKLVKGEADD